MFPPFKKLNQKQIKNDFCCNYHNESYNSFCKDCNKNLCICCEINHKSHKIIYFGQIMPSQNEVNSEIAEFKENIHKFKTIIEKLKDNLNEIYRNIVKYYYYYSEKMEKLKEKKRNYEIIIKASTLKNDYIIQNLKNIITKNSKIEEKFSTIFNIKYKLDENTFLENYNLPNTSNIFFKNDFKGKCVMNIYDPEISIGINHNYNNYYDIEDCK